MTMLVSLNDMKNYLGISLVDTSHDTFLTQQITVVSDSIEEYCARAFSQTTYSQTFFEDDMPCEIGNELTLFHYPLVSVTSVKERDDYASVSETDVTDFLPVKYLGMLKKLPDGTSNPWFYYGRVLEVVYVAGFSAVPTPIAQVVYSIVSDKYSKKVSGVDIGFGSDVQRVSIPGVISVDYDYTLTANDRKSPMGMLLGNYLNVLDCYRSERALVGQVSVVYVD